MQSNVSAGLARLSLAVNDMNRRALILGGVALVFVVGACFFFRPAPADSDPRSGFGTRIKQDPFRPRVHVVHYPMSYPIGIPDDPLPPYFHLEADGRLSTTIAATDATAAWQTPGIVPSELKRSIKTFLERAVLDEILTQAKHLPGIVQTNTSRQALGMVSVGPQGMSQTGTYKVDADGEFVDLPRTTSPMAKNVLQIRISGAASASLNLTTDQIKVSPTANPPGPAQPPSGIPNGVTLNQGFSQGNAWAPDAELTISSVDEAADDLLKQCVDNIRAQQHPAPPPIVNQQFMAVSTLPGLDIQYAGYQTTNLSTCALIAPVDPEQYARQVVKTIEDEMEQDRRNLKSSLDSLNQVSQAQPGFKMTLPTMPPVTKVTVRFVMMPDLLLQIPNVPTAQYPNGAAVVRAQEDAFRSAAVTVRLAAVNVNRAAAKLATSPVG